MWFRIKKPFIYSVNVPVNQGTASLNGLLITSFSIDEFFADLHRVFSVERSFFGFPFTVQREETQNGNETWVKAILKIDAMDEKEYQELETLSSCNLMLNESFYIAFNMIDINGQRRVTEFATNLDCRTFRRAAILMSGFTKAFFESLLQTEYFIYEEGIAINVRSRYEFYKQRDKGKAMPYAMLLTSMDEFDSQFPTLYFLNPQPGYDVRRRFLQLSYTYYYLTQPQSTPKLTLQQFMSPLSQESRADVATYIGQLFQKGGIFAEKNVQHKKPLVLYVGAAEGLNPSALNTHFPNMHLVSVEPTKGCLINYKGNIEDVFLMSVEELSILSDTQNLFDNVVIFNFWVNSNATQFWDAIQSMLKPGGTIIIGHFMGDPVVGGGPKTLFTYLRERFSKVEFVEMPKAVRPPMSITLPSNLNGTDFDFFNSHLQQENVILQEMSKLIETDFPTVTEARTSLQAYALCSRQILYKATKVLENHPNKSRSRTETKQGSEPIVENKRGQEQETGKLFSPFAEHMIRIS